MGQRGQQVSIQLYTCRWIQREVEQSRKTTQEIMNVDVLSVARLMSYTSLSTIFLSLLFFMDGGYIAKIKISPWGPREMVRVTLYDHKLHQW